jgi:hypothetical protein
MKVNGFNALGWKYESSICRPEVRGGALSAKNAAADADQHAVVARGHNASVAVPKCELGVSA